MYLDKRLKNEVILVESGTQSTFLVQKRIPMISSSLLLMPRPVSLDRQHAHVSHIAFFPKLGKILSYLPGSVPVQLIASSCFKFPLQCLSKADSSFTILYGCALLLCPGKQLLLSIPAVVEFCSGQSKLYTCCIQPRKEKS